MVQEPREIIECVKEKSLRSNFLIYLIISASERYLLKTSNVKKSEERLNLLSNEISSLK